MWMLVLLAAAGLLVSLAVHVSTFFGLDLQELHHWIWLLHVGAIAICVPAMILQRRTGPNTRSRSSKPSFSDFCPLAPGWMQRLLPIFFIYTFLNFGIFMVRDVCTGSGHPYHEPDGTYTLHYRRQPTRQISEQEYHRRNDQILRGFSGHWMLFYGIAMATLTSVAIARQSSDERRPA